MTKTQFTQWAQQGQIVKATPSDILHEINVLEKLQKKKKNYLTKYNILFRYVGIWLGKQGWTFSNQAPHKTLKWCLSLTADISAIEPMIQDRHAIKYGKIKHPKRVSENTLDQLLKVWERM